MKMLLKRYWLPVTGILLGALGGYLYWRFVGCAKGTCPITSSTFASTVWGAAIGGLFVSSFKIEKKYDSTCDVFDGGYTIAYACRL